MTDGILVFVKNPILGQVKTRLARRVGQRPALEIYQELLEYTLRVALLPHARRWVAYSDFVPEEDAWQRNGFEPLLQASSPDLGVRLDRAVLQAFAEGIQRLLVIGSDCPELKESHLTQALHCLLDHQAVLGPCHDGGYYLLGLRQPLASLFWRMPWSTDQVFAETVRRLEQAGWTWAALETLSDLDE